MKKATNAALMKENNKKILLGHIRRGNCSRAELAKKTGLTKAAVTILTEEMLREGFIEEREVKEYKNVGRRPIELLLCERTKYVIGFTLTRNHYYAGIFDLTGNVINSVRKRYSEKKYQTCIKDMLVIIDEYKKLVPENTIFGVGIASPGPVDYKNGVIINPPNFEMWHGVNIKSELEKKCGLNVYLENIANAFAMAEMYFGGYHNEESFAYVAANEGIGSGIIINNEIYRGKRGFGNELGHISIIHNGMTCACGNTGCLECYASMPAFLRNTSYSSWEELVQNNEFGLIDEEAHYLATGIISLVNLFDLGEIVIGGDVVYNGKYLLNKIKEEVEAKTLITHPINFVLSSLEDRLELTGAAIALYHSFYKIK